MELTHARWNRPRLKVVVTFLCSIPLIFVAASPAAAVDGWQPTVDTPEEYQNGPGHVCGYTESFGRGGACFVPLGEWVWVRDQHADLQPVAVPWDVYDPSTGTYRSGVIYNTFGTEAGWTNLNKSFNENLAFRFKVCALDLPNRYVYSCGEWKVATT